MTAPEEDVPRLVDTDDVPRLESRVEGSQASIASSSASQPRPSATRLENDGAGGKDQYERKKVPLTLLTGYLGAGKSTLLEYILTADHGYKIAVCMNDFGDTTDIESSALTLTDPLTGAQSTEFLSLPNGCLCCSFKDMGMAAVEEMAHAQGVDWVMVELTGLADPGPIAKGFWENEEMGDLVLDGVVCVVDCRNVLKQLADRPQGSGTTNEAQRQIACADVLLLNKTDLVDGDTADQVERTIRNLNPTTRIHRTHQSRLPLQHIFNVQSYSDTSLDADQARQWQYTASTGHAHTHTHAGGDTCNPTCSGSTSGSNSDTHARTLHDSSITSTLIPLPTLSSEGFSKLNDFLESVLWTDKLPSALAQSGHSKGTESGSSHQASLSSMGVEVLRTKGLIRRTDGIEFVLQGVTDIFELKEVKGVDKGAKGPEGQEGQEGYVEGKVVFIGRGVNVLRERLIEYLDL